MSNSRVIVIGGGSRIGRAVALASARRGAEVVAAGRTPKALAEVATDAARDHTRSPVHTMTIDLSRPETIESFASEVGPFDHLVSTVSMHASGPLTELTDSDIQRAIDAKIFGPLRLARALHDLVRPGGSFTFFSGQAAWAPRAGSVVTSTVNGALAFLVQALAVEFAPIRVNAIAPGLVDSGALDSLGEKKQAILDHAAMKNPVGRVGTIDDVVGPTLMTMTNGYMTGAVVRIDGGGPLT